MKFFNKVRIVAPLPSLNILNATCIERENTSLSSEEVRQPAFPSTYINRHIQSRYHSHIVFYKRSCLSSLLLLLLFLVLPLPLSAQEEAVYTLQGKVTDAKSSPIAYANIVLYESGSDTMLTGGTTDESGHFKITVSANISKLEAVASCLGYETKLVNLMLTGANTTVEDIVLEEVPIELESVMVTADRPIIQMTASTIEARVKGTVLAKTCFFLDQVLNKIPFVAGDGLNYEVFGKGKAQVYLNGVKVTNPETLLRYKAKDILNVVVDLAPGGEVGADRGAAIYITATNPDDGFSVSAHELLYCTKAIANASGIAFAYYKGGHELFLDAAHSYTISERWFEETLQHEKATIRQRQEGRGRVNHLKLNAGYSYSSKRFSFGVSDIFTTSRNKSTSTFHILHSAAPELLQFGSDRKGGFYRNAVEAYFKANLGEATEATLQGDYLMSKGSGESITQSADTQYGRSDNHSQWERAFAFLVFKTRMGGSEWSYGADYDWSRRRYREDAIDHFGQQQVGGTNRYAEFTLAPFLSYRFTHKAFSLTASLRSETTRYQGEERRKTITLLAPSLYLGYSHHHVHYSVSYRRTPYRPSFSQMNDLVFASIPYFYSMGNSLAQAGYSDRLTLSVARGQLMLYAQLQRAAHINKTLYEPYKEIEGRQTFLERYTALQPYYDVSMGLSHTLSIAKWYKLGYELNGGILCLGQDLNKLKLPRVSIELDHNFTLPKDFHLNIELGYSYGGSGFALASSHFTNELSISKSWKGFMFRLSAGNWLMNKTQKSREAYRGMAFNRVAFHDSQSVTLLISYTFDYKERKYTADKKGTDASRF